MKKMHQPLVIANWKMNPQTLTEAKQIFVGIKNVAKKHPSVSVVVAPPAIYLMELMKFAGSAVSLAAQNTHYELLGSFTGEISPTMISALGAKYIIVGHSERRMIGESNGDVAKKIMATLKARLTPIVCIGESARDSQGNFFTFIETQIETAFEIVPRTRFKDIVIAYEPIWAIGTGATATIEDVKEMQLFILKILTKHFGRTAAEQVTIIYGGSVKPDNAVKLYEAGGMSGFLVGGASLKVTDFATIIVATAN
ncbi:triose-phosphate isomerase [Candidatus Kaiserbacteria bacterium CG_4_9_14_0_2_um_filter_41_32]|uniref:Triosephosphate isomerase n=1 Tax=Candidatus Kaiserbacteria bacterium CG_4_9_14_0_2_um_filter_41_32 TaxID=1974601 RepID=A0A2M8FE69_9BACT|nr:MAG: triose-phosphate isomerase [Candidatus Kaiserbacteria bacterium CG_4_9_14_0_2_um_filter_41_32]